MPGTTVFTVLRKMFVIYFNRNAIKGRYKVAVLKLAYACPGDT